MSRRLTDIDVPTMMESKTYGKVWATVDGVQTKIYNLRREKGSNLIEGVIESRDGATFVLHYLDTRGVQSEHIARLLWFEIDGTQTIFDTIPKDSDHFNEPLEHPSRVWTYEDVSITPTERQTFVFSPPSITEDENKACYDLMYEDIGTIKLKIYRIEILSPPKINLKFQKDQNFPDSLKKSSFKFLETKLKYAGVSHQIDFRRTSLVPEVSKSITASDSTGNSNYGNDSATASWNESISTINSRNKYAAETHDNEESAAEESEVDDQVEDREDDSDASEDEHDAGLLLHCRNSDKLLPTRIKLLSTPTGKSKLIFQFRYMSRDLLEFLEIVPTREVLLQPKIESKPVIIKEEVDLEARLIRSTRSAAPEVEDKILIKSLAVKSSREIKDEIKEEVINSLIQPDTPILGNVSNVEKELASTEVPIHIKLKKLQDGINSSSSKEYDTDLVPKYEEEVELGIEIDDEDEDEVELAKLQAASQAETTRLQLASQVLQERIAKRKADKELLESKLASKRIKLENGAEEDRKPNQEIDTRNLGVIVLEDSDEEVDEKPVQEVEIQNVAAWEWEKVVVDKEMKWDIEQDYSNPWLT